MKRRRLMIVLVGLVAVLGLAGTPAYSAEPEGVEVQETPLSQAGSPYELNVDSQGVLWVSDYGAGEIRSFDPSSGAYTAYPVGDGPSDARGDGAGWVWWADFDSNRLSRLSIATLQVTTWEIPGSSNSLYSTAIDSDGNVWVSDSYDSFVYKLDPGANQLCSFALPDSGVTDYLYVDGQQLWFGDTVNARIVRLQGSTLDWWNLPAGSYPRHLQLDGDDRVWWTDAVQGYVGRLDSGAATMATFTPPAGGAPVMLAPSDGKMWISQENPGGMSVLDPAVAASDSFPVSPGSRAVAPVCGELQPLPPSTITATTDQMSWTARTYPTALDSGGWVIYDMPNDAKPWGICAADQIWLVDQGRRVLAGLGPVTSPFRIYLPLARKG